MKILVIQTAFPGDAILTLPLIQELRKRNQSAQIDVLCIPSTAILFNSSSSVNNVIEFDKRRIDSGIRGLYKLIKKLRSIKYDVVYSPHRSARSSIISFLSFPKQSYSFDKTTFSFFYKNLVKYKKDWHEVRRNLSLLNDFSDDNNWKILPQLEVNDSDKKKVDDFLNSFSINHSKIIAVAPGSVWATKRYPAEYYLSLTEKLTELNFTVVLVGGKEDFNLSEKIINGNSKIFNFCGRLNFIQSIYLLTKSVLLISNDSAPTHLGMCADIPVLTIYCSTVPDFGFYPYNKSSRYISYDKLECKPCGIHGFNKCPEKHFQCGYKLLPETVLREAISMLEERHSRHN